MPLIEIGRKAPAFALADQHGKSHSPKHYLGRPFVVYFYPEDNTPDCTNQACQLRDLHPDFSKLGCTVLAISPDDLSSHQAFADQHRLDFPVLVDARDPQGRPSTCHAYGAWVEKNLYGRKYMGIIRTTYLVAPDGRIARRWDRVKVSGHARDVLASVRMLEGTHSAQKKRKGSPTGKRPRTKQHGKRQAPVRGVRGSVKPRSPGRASR